MLYRYSVALYQLLAACFNVLLEGLIILLTLKPC